MEDQFFYLLTAALVGVIVGAILMYFFSGSKGGNNKSTKDIEQKLNTYKDEVAEHFEKTADLVEELTQNYKKVFDHLGKSARHLMTDEQLKLQIDKRKGNKVTLEFLNEDKDVEIKDEIDDDVEKVVDNNVNDAAENSVIESADAKTDSDSSSKS